MMFTCIAFQCYVVLNFISIIYLLDGELLRG